MSYIVVQNYINLPEKASNSVPFSWRIKDYLEELWVHTQYITGNVPRLVSLLHRQGARPCNWSGKLYGSAPISLKRDAMKFYARDLKGREETDFLSILTSFYSL